MTLWQGTASLRFDARAASRRFAALGLVLGILGLVVCFASFMLAVALAQRDLIHLAVAISLGAFFTAAAGVAFSVVSLALSRAYWRRAVVAPSLFGALMWLVAFVD